MLMHKLLIFLSAFTFLLSAAVLNPTKAETQPSEVAGIETPGEFKVEFFPVAPYHVGDLISTRVTYIGTGDIKGKEIHISLHDQPGTILETEKFSKYDNQAEFYWILDTSSFQPGFTQFTFEIPEINLSWQEGINLLPSYEDQDQEWAFVETNWGRVYYIEGTDAAEDISLIQDILEETADKASTQFFPDGIPQENPLEEGINLVLIPAIIGHGGFAADMAVVTYSDRNWVGSSLKTIIHHEIVHVLDRKLNDEGPRPSILSEGIAVYLSGGHYRDGDPLLRASALLTLGKYIPLEELADDFYNAQHEIAYMEGAALAAYLVELWGWESFLDFYFDLEEMGSDSETISTALEDKIGMNLEEVESEFVDFLSALKPNETVLSDVLLTIEVYDMIRRYQTALLPSAHFRTAWWPPIEKVLEIGITDDYNKREKSPLNIIIENRLIKIQEAFSTQDYQFIEHHLAIIDNHLEIIESSGASPSHYHLGWPLPHNPQIIKKP